MLTFNVTDLACRVQSNFFVTSSLSVAVSATPRALAIAHVVLLSPSQPPSATHSRAHATFRSLLIRSASRATLSIHPHLNPLATFAFL